MRVNVWDEEMGDDTVLVIKPRDAGSHSGTYYGVRLYLNSPYGLEEDDRGAVTFWTKAAGFQELASTLNRMADLAFDIEQLSKDDDDTDTDEEE